MQKKKSRRELLRELKALQESHAKMAYIILGILIQCDGVILLDKSSASLIDSEMTFTLAVMDGDAGWRISLDIPEKDDAPSVTITDPEPV